MITQIELNEMNPDTNRNLVFWVSHQPYNGQILKVGDRIVLTEGGIVERAGMIITTPLTIKGTFVSLADGCPLPPKARVGTLLEILN